MADNEKKVVPFPTPNPVNEPVRPGKSLTVTLSPKGTFIRGLSGSAKENLIPILCVILFLWCEEDPLLESGSFTLSAANWGRSSRMRKRSCAISKRSSRNTAVCHC